MLERKLVANVKVKLNLGENSSSNQDVCSLDFGYDYVPDETKQATISKNMRSMLLLLGVVKTYVSTVNILDEEKTNRDEIVYDVIYSFNDLESLIVFSNRLKQLAGRKIKIDGLFIHDLAKGFLRAENVEEYVTNYAVSVKSTLTDVPFPDNLKVYPILVRLNVGSEVHNLNMSKLKDVRNIKQKLNIDERGYLPGVNVYGVVTILINEYLEENNIKVPNTVGKRFIFSKEENNIVLTVIMND